MSDREAVLIFLATCLAVAVFIVSAISLGRQGRQDYCEASCHPSVGHVAPNGCVCAQADGVWTPAPEKKP